jgi:hypothetical protein
MLALWAWLSALLAIGNAQNAGEVCVGQCFSALVRACSIFSNNGENIADDFDGSNDDMSDLDPCRREMWTIAA